MSVRTIQTKMHHTHGYNRNTSSRTASNNDLRSAGNSIRNLAITFAISVLARLSEMFRRAFESRVHSTHLSGNRFSSPERTKIPKASSPSFSLRQRRSDFLDPMKISNESAIPMNRDMRSQKPFELQELDRTSSEALLKDPGLSMFHSHESLGRLTKEQKRWDRRRFRRIRIFGRYFWTSNRLRNSLKLECRMSNLSGETPVHKTRTD